MEGAGIGSWLGDGTGTKDGAGIGSWLGDGTGSVDSASIGSWLGDGTGTKDGAGTVGFSVGRTVGLSVGSTVVGIPPYSTTYILTYVRPSFGISFQVLCESVNMTA
jgi:hypothetical protein